MRRNVIIVAVLACVALASVSWAAPPFGRFGGRPDGGNGANGILRLTGWALDDDGVRAVDFLVDGVVVGRAVYGRSRPGVLQQYPEFPNADGAGYAYSLDTTRFTNGLHTVQVRVTSVSGEVSFLNSRVFQFFNDTHSLVPFGRIDYPQAQLEMWGRCNSGPPIYSVIDGYALDVGVQEEDTGVGYVELLIDRALWSNTRVNCNFVAAQGGLSNCYGMESFPIESEFPGVKNATHAGYRFVIDVGALVGSGFYARGNHLLTIRAGDHADQDANIAEQHVNFRCVEDLANQGAVGEIQYPIKALLYGGIISIKGWALDLQGVFAVDVYIDGVFRGQATYGLSSPAFVKSRNPSVPGHAFAGYSFDFDTTTLSNGRHTIEVKVRDFLLFDASIGKFDIRVGNPNGSISQQFAATKGPAHAGPFHFCWRRPQPIGVPVVGGLGWVCSWREASRAAARSKSFSAAWIWLSPAVIAWCPASRPKAPLRASARIWRNAKSPAAGSASPCVTSSRVPIFSSTSQFPNCSRTEDSGCHSRLGTFWVRV